MAQHFTDAILSAAKASMPQSSGTAHHPLGPWWNPDCAVAIQARKQALTQIQRHPTMDNLINYKRLCSRARRVIRDSKKSSWRAYISSITHHTSSRDVWHKVRKIKGMWSPCTISGLLIHGSIETAQVAIVNELASHFASVSCSNNYSPTFQLIKVKEESKVLDFSTASSDDCNIPFTLSELQSSLSCAHNTAPGPDQIHNTMLTYRLLHCIFSSLSTTEFGLTTPFQIAGKRPSSSLLQRLERFVPIFYLLPNLSHQLSL